MMTHKELQEMIEQLSDYQVNQIAQTALRYLTLNRELVETKPDSCPCCGDIDAIFIRKGIQRGKQRFQCKSCGHKFTYDTKRLTSHSQQPVESWAVVLEDTLALESLDATAEKISVCHSTAFHMRHKLLAYMEVANRCRRKSLLPEQQEISLRLSDSSKGQSLWTAE